MVGGGAVPLTKELHCARMSKRMDSDAFVFQGGTPGPGGGQMLGQKVVEAVVAERTAALIGEQRFVRFAIAFPQPCP